MDREGVTYTNLLAILLTRNPFRHGGNDTKNFLVQIGVDGLDDLGIDNGAVLVDDKLNYNTTLNTLLLTYGRVHDIILQIQRESLCPPKLRFSFHNCVNPIIIICFRVLIFLAKGLLIIYFL